MSVDDAAVPFAHPSAMSLSGSYGAANDEESLQLLQKALDLGCTFWDTAIVYGFGHNEALLGRFFRENPGAREKVFVGTKCGWDVSDSARVCSALIPARL